MEKTKFKTRQEEISYQLANYATGGKFDILEKAYVLLVSAIANLTAIFYRHRFGLRSLNGLNILWSWLTLSLITILTTYLFEEASLTRSQLNAGQGHQSMSLFWFHTIAFLVVAIYRNWSLRKDLRLNRNKRHGESVGTSLLWPYLERLLRPILLAPKAGSRTLWFQLDHIKFQKLIEPFLICMIGVAFKKAGYEAYGIFLMISALCLFITALKEEAKYYQNIQNSWDAELGAESMILPDSSENASSQHTISTPHHKKEKEFEKWLHSQQTQSHFEQT